MSENRPHTLPPTQLFLSHLVPSLTHTSTEILAQHATLQTENAAILARVVQQRRDIAAMMQGLEKAVGDLEGSVVALGGAELEDEALRGE